MQQQLEQLHISSNMVGLLAHVIEGHVIRFQSSQILKDEEAMIEHAGRNA